MRERFRPYEQELGHKIWTIVRLFYRSLVIFREQFESYEARVLEHSARTGIARQDLRLSPDELASLLDLKKLERMRDGHLQELKDLCHLVFRGHDSTDLFDRYVSDIFHEVSILKEEHYSVHFYAPYYEKHREEVELNLILNEAHTLFPQKLRQVRYLFEKAEGRMRELLGSFRNIPLFTRSLYLHRDDFVREAYPEGLLEFYRLMYPQGPVEGFYQVGLSFYHAGFRPEALLAFQQADDAYRQALAAANGREKGLSSELRSLRRLLSHKRAKLAREVARARAKGGYPWLLKNALGPAVQGAGPGDDLSWGTTEGNGS